MRACIAGQKPLTLAELKAIEMLFNRVYGRPREQIQFDLNSVGSGENKWEKLVAEVTIVANQEQTSLARDVMGDIEEGEVLDDSYEEEETYQERQAHLTAVESQRPNEIVPRSSNVPATPVWPVNPSPPPSAPQRGPKGASHG